MGINRLMQMAVCYRKLKTLKLRRWYIGHQMLKYDSAKKQNGIASLELTLHVISGGCLPYLLPSCGLLLDLKPSNFVTSSVQCEIRWSTACRKHLPLPLIEHLYCLNVICEHGQVLPATGRANQLRVQRFGEAVLKLHVISKEHLKVLKADDEAAYMELIDTAKDATLPTSFIRLIHV